MSLLAAYALLSGRAEEVRQEVILDVTMCILHVYATMIITLHSCTFDLSLNILQSGTKSDAGHGVDG